MALAKLLITEPRTSPLLNQLFFFLPSSDRMGSRPSQSEFVKEGVRKDRLGSLFVTTNHFLDGL